jgi:tetratricopeptide (TPR) repeat protein
MNSPFKLLALVLLTGSAAMTATTADAQNEKYGSTPEQQQACKEALSLYSTYYKQKSYDDALPFWRAACATCPDGVKQSLYMHGVTLLKGLRNTSLAAEPVDSVRVTELNDSIFMLYDRRMEFYPSTTKKPNNGCDVLVRKATDWLKFYKEDHATANVWFKEAIDCLGTATPASALSSYFLTLHYAKRDAETEEEKSKAITSILSDYLMIQGFINDGLKAAESAGDARGEKGYISANKNVNQVFLKVAECEDMVPLLAGKTAAAPDDFDLKVKSLALLENRNCTDNDLYLPLARAVYDSLKTPSSAFAIGRLLLKEGDFVTAIVYLEEAVENNQDPALQAKYELKTGLVASNLGQIDKAMSYAKSVRRSEPKNGLAYLLMGDVIAASASRCEDGAIGGRAVYWLATDYYNKAKSVDSEVKEKANKKISAVKKQYPTVDDLFTYGKSEGELFYLNCFGESTKIRAR